MSIPRYLTKSRFKLASECPTKLFYTGKNNVYANQKIDDPFLMALAKGGFQVGELAKCYFPEGIEVKAGRGDYESALSQTNELLLAENVTIFEAAIRYRKFFIRVDVLVKIGNQLELIEVKSKSYREGESQFFGKSGTWIDATLKPYLYDVAFQKHVVLNAFPDHTVSAYLMLADKASFCPTDGLNQKFRVKTGVDDQKYVELAAELTAEEIHPDSWILRKVPVDNACDRIFAGTDMKLPEAKSFAERAEEFADYYERDERIASQITGDCKTCEFQTTPEEEVEGKRSGLKECWSQALGWTNADFEVPTMLDVWDNRNKDKMIGAGKIKMSDLVEGDIDPKKADKSGISRTQRQWLQVEKVNNNDDQYFLDTEGLRAEMTTWMFPLHFIDFETATPAIPFTKGRRPYEEIAFQFSHHIVDASGKVEHVGQFLDEEIGAFPNYEFIRKLRDELSGDDGTIFRYAAHENTYLNAIYRQLIEDKNHIADSEELCVFIKSISKSKKDSIEKWEGERNMVDLREMVLRFYYDPYTQGSNSIKQVLPAILNSSTYLRDKYSKPIYGTDIRSLNFPSGKTWVEFDGTLLRDPYSGLPKMFGSEMIERLSDEDELKDGGAAMMAYARLQFEDMSDTERSEIRNALLRYCELDTLAMVMIYEGWREMIRSNVCLY